MKFFRKGLEDSITLPPHPSSKDEVQEVRDAMNKRTAKMFSLLEITTEFLSMRLKNIVKIMD